MPTPDILPVAETPGPANANASLFVRDVDPLLHFYKTNEHPLASMILTQGLSLVERDGMPMVVGKKQLKKKGYGSSKVEWFEDDVFAKRSFNPTAPVLTGDTSISVSSTDDDNFRANDMITLSNASGQSERLKISSVAANTLNVVNADGTARTNGIVMNTSDRFFRGENVRADDSTAPPIRSTTASEQYNYLQMISETYGATIRGQLSNQYNAKNQFDLEKAKAYSRLLEQIEHMAFLGTRALISSTSEYHNGGYKYFAELYSDVDIRNMGGQALTFAEFNSFVGSVSKSGSPEKVAFCSNRVLEVINGFALENVQTEGYRVGEIGMNVRRVFTSHGALTLVHEPLFDLMPDIFGGSMIILDMNDIEFCYLNGGAAQNVPGIGSVPDGDLRAYPILTADGNMSAKAQWFGIVGWKFTTLKHTGWMKNVGV